MKINHNRKGIGDFRILAQIIQRWFSILPDLDFFNEWKESLKGRMPSELLFSDKKTYKGMTSVYVYSEEELLHKLFGLTESLLREIDTSGLVKKGQIREAKLLGLKAGVEEHKIRQTKLLEGFSKGEKIYLDIIQDWLKNETDFLKNYLQPHEKELSQLYSPLKKVKIASGPQGPTTRVWALYLWYLREIGHHEELWGQTGNKKKFLNDFADDHGISKQNLFQTFNAIGHNQNKNPKRNPDNIRKVIPLLAGFPEAQKLAKEELERLKQKK